MSSVGSGSARFASISDTASASFALPPPMRAATGAIWRTEALARTPLLRRFITPGYPTMFNGIPTRDLFKLVGGLLISQIPNHHPGDVKAPEWFHTWMQSYAAGADMAHFYGTGAIADAR